MTHQCKFWDQQLNMTSEPHREVKQKRQIFTVVISVSID